MTDPTHIQQSTYVIIWRQAERIGVEEVRVFRYTRREDADAFAKAPNPDPRDAALAVTPSTDSLAGVSSALILALFNAMRDPDESSGEPVVAKFADRTVARNRFFARLETKYGSLPVIEAPVITTPTATAAGSPTTTEVEVKKTKVKAAAAKEPKAKRSNGLEAAPAGKVSDLKEFRAGTIRAKVLKAMNGTKTIAGIASAAEITEGAVISCVRFFVRECGIGVALDGEKVTAILPGSKTIDDVIKAAKP